MTNTQSLGTIEATNPVLAVAPLKEETEMLRATDKITALYCRLSVEDLKEDKKGGKEDESNSIQNQKMILLQYAKEHRFPNPTFFVDDGYSGTNFDRPGFQAMLAEIEAGRVAVCCTKDLSRLGRNSSLTGLYINFTFPKYNVRYIAINDHFDTIDPNSTDSDIAGIKNWFNEFFAKDTSRKIRAVNKAKGERGVPLTVNVPFGYRKDPEDKTKWVVDEAAALVVKRIFKLCMEGRGPMQIAKLLQEEKVLNPTAYKKREGIKTPSPETADPYHWNTNTVVHILERREYTGCTVNFKTYTNSIWDKKQRETPIEKQAVFYNTHPAIIEQEVFDKVQEIRQQRHRRTKTGKSSLFSGMVYCADCGAKMRYCTTNYFEKRQDHFVCANYRSNTGSCSAHFIRAVVLEELVWMHMRTVISYVSRYEDHFRAVMEQKLRLSSEAAIRGHKKRLTQPEALAVYRHTLQNDFRLTLSYHTQGNIIYWRYLDYLPPRSREIADAMAKASGYSVEETPPVSGYAGYKDWFIQTYDRPGYTIEAGQGTSPLPLTEFDALYADNLGILVLGLALAVQPPLPPAEEPPAL